MKKALYGWMVVAGILLLQYQGGLTAMEKTEIYQVTYQMQNVTGQITINGFIVTEMTLGGGNGAAVLNPWLIGDNELKAEVKKIDPSKPAELIFGLSEMVQGDMVSTTDKGKLFSLELKNKDFANGTASAAKKFKSAIDFKRHLLDAGQVKESDILAYALKIHALYQKKDAEGILRESEVKISDYSEAFGGVDMKSELRDFLTGEVFKSKLDALNPSALRAVAVGPTNKIWHVMNGKAELIKGKSPDGSTFETAVYVGLLDGKLKIVR